MNPEPIAPFFDAIVIGEGEDVIPQIVEIVQRCEGEPRGVVLEELATLEGVYVPLLHTPDSRQPGFKPVKRLWVKDLRDRPTRSSLYTPDTEFGDLHLMEIARGCGRGCRFCLAGYVYRPPREVDADTLLSWAREGLKHRQKVGLISAAVSDHTEIDYLAVELRKLGARISVSSMRTDPISVPLVKAMAESGTQTLTIAPEAGSERLRNVINKTQTFADMMEAVELAESLKFPQLKLYFMVGHPTETDDDVQALIDFAMQVRKRFKRRLALNTTPYVPKAHTPFQWKAMTAAKVLERRQDKVKRALAKHNVAVRADSPAWAEVQAVLSRGDRRIAKVLLDLESMSVPNFHKALTACGLSAADYLGDRLPGSPLPWDIVESNVSSNYFAWELRLAEQNQTGHSCPPDSAGCLTCQACTPEWAFRHTDGVPMKKEGTYTSTGKLVSPIALLNSLSLGLNQDP